MQKKEKVESFIDIVFELICMKNKGFSKWIKKIFLTSEETLFNKFREHTMLSLKAIDILIDLYADDKNNKERLYYWIEKIEKQGDELSSQIINAILDGAIMVSLQNYLISLTDILDDILDTIHFLAGETLRKKYFARLKNQKIIEIENNIGNYILHSKKSIELLKKLTEDAINGKWNKIREIVALIERNEEEGDDIKHSLINEIYRGWEEIKEPYFSHLVHFIYEIDELEDLAEDASDMILMALQHIKS